MALLQQTMTLRDQLRNITPVLIIIFAATVVLLTSVVLVANEKNITLNHFTKDPVQLMDAPFYLGFFSNLGILIWSASAVLCFYSWLLIPKTQVTSPVRWFLLFSGLITMMFVFDDLYLVHERVFPRLFGIPEKGAFIIYINLMLLYLISFRNIIMKTDYIILGFACFLIGGSTFVKRIPMPIPEDSFLEDAVKLFGIVCWFVYFARTCFRETIKVQ